MKKKTFIPSDRKKVVIGKNRKKVKKWKRIENTRQKIKEISENRVAKEEK